MNIVSGLVLYSVLWFMTYLVVIPIRLKTQGDVGEVVPGTHAGAPQVHNLRKKALITTLVAFVIWLILAAIITSGVISLEAIDRWTAATGWRPAN